MYGKSVGQQVGRCFNNQKAIERSPIGAGVAAIRTGRGGARARERAIVNRSRDRESRQQMLEIRSTVDVARACVRRPTLRTSIPSLAPFSPFLSHIRDVTAPLPSLRRRYDACIPPSALLAVRIESGRGRYTPARRSAPSRGQLAFYLLPRPPPSIFLLRVLSRFLPHLSLPTPSALRPSAVSQFSLFSRPTPPRPAAHTRRYSRVRVREVGRKTRWSGERRRVRTRRTTYGGGPDENVRR